MKPDIEAGLKLMRAEQELCAQVAPLIERLIRDIGRRNEVDIAELRLTMIAGKDRDSWSAQHCTIIRQPLLTSVPRSDLPRPRADTGDTLAD